MYSTYSHTHITSTIKERSHKFTGWVTKQVNHASTMFFQVIAIRYSTYRIPVSPLLIIIFLWEGGFWMFSVDRLECKLLKLHNTRNYLPRKIQPIQHKMNKKNSGVSINIVVGKIATRWITFP